MRLLRCALFSLSAVLLASGPDPKDTYKSLEAGAKLTPEAAAVLEQRLEKKPRDMAARIQLLSYYVSPKALENPAETKAKRLRHILWLAQNDPLEGGGLFQVASRVYAVNCEGDALADAEGCRQVQDAWLAQLAAHPKEAGLRIQAVEALELSRPEEAEKILLEARDMQQLGRLYAGAALGISGWAYTSSEPAGSLAARRSSPFAAHAIAELERSQDRAMVAAATNRLLREGALLYADGKLDWDYSALGKTLLLRARSANPERLELYALSAELPARGERPPAIVRVGGNAQQKMLTQQVPPVYPPAAKLARIQGTVGLAALIGLDGKVLRLALIDGPLELVPGSIAAVRQWEYKPTLLNGKPVFVVTQIDINYVLH